MKKNLETQIYKKIKIIIKPIHQPIKSFSPSNKFTKPLIKKVLTIFVTIILLSGKKNHPPICMINYTNNEY